MPSLDIEGNNISMLPSIYNSQSLSSLDNNVSLNMIQGIDGFDWTALDGNDHCTSDILNGTIFGI